MADYLDLYSRQYLRQADAWHFGGAASPDLLPWGTSPNPDPSQLATPASWAQDPGVGLVPGVDNHLYVRTRNPGSAAIPGRMYLGAAKPTFLCWPDTLAPVKSTNQKPYVDVKVAAGEVGVSTEGFVFRPTTGGDTLASWIYTVQHPVVPPALRDINALLQFIRDTPAYVQRSLAFGLADGAYRFTGDYEQRDVDAVVAFELAWVDCPAGWTLSLLPTSGGTDVTLGPITVGTTSGSLMCKRDLRAGFGTVLELGIDTAGIEPLPGTSVEVRVLLLGEIASGTSALLPVGGHRWCAGPQVARNPKREVVRKSTRSKP